SYAGAVKAAATQLARSIDDVLDMAEIDADEMALDVTPVDVAELLLETAARWWPQAEAGRVSIIMAPPQNVGVIRGDRRRLAQVLDHLMENALGQTPPGGTVSLAARKSAGVVQLQVADTGRGIPFHVQAH
ncbi:MAG: sensor histidine kinase, partial [Phenylobacterium sp.]